MTPSNRLTTAWFAEDVQDKHRLIFNVLESLKKQSENRHLCLDIYQSLYQGTVPRSLRNFDKILPQFNPQYNMTENLVQAVIDQLLSKLGKNKPKPSIVTQGAMRYSTRDRATKLNRYMLGEFDRLKAYEVGKMCLRDAFIDGTGVARIGIDSQTNRIFLERVLIHELYVDWNDSRYGKPSQLFYVKRCSRDKIKAEFPEYDLELEQTPLTEEQIEAGTAFELTDQIKVVECWKLPDSPDHPGRHVISVENVALVDEPYTEDAFPFIFLNYKDPKEGFWGIGITQEIVQIQVALNETLQRMQKALDLVADPYILIHKRSGVKKSHMESAGMRFVGKTIEYDGTPPQVVTPPAINPALQSWADRLRERAFEIVGVTQINNPNQTPFGANTTGQAYREYNNITSERFVLTGQAYEKFYLDLGEWIIKLSKEIYKSKRSLNTTYVRAGEFGPSKIKWKDVDMDRDEFTMKMWSLALFADSPEAQVQKVQEWVNSGAISQEVGRELMDYPDYDAWADLEKVSKDLVAQVVEEILFEDEDHVPESTWNLQYAQKYAQNMILWAQLQKMDEEAIERLRIFEQRVMALLPQNTASNVPGPSQGAAGGPGGVAPQPQAANASQGNVGVPAAA